MHKKAFTLIELSIVLSVIAVLLSGIFTGQKLIKQANHKKQVSQIIHIGQAMRNFQIKYGALPGDISNASSFISGAGNGNGDGDIFGASLTTNELYYAWNHLTSSKILEGSYDGSTSFTPGTSIPYGKIDGSALSFQDNYNSNGTARETGYNSINLQAITASKYQLLTNQDAYFIDIKYDDGNGKSGYIQAYNNPWTSSTSHDCVHDTTTSTNGEYELDQSGIKCWMNFDAMNLGG